MTEEEQATLIELLEKLRDERILEIAENYELTERDIRKKLCREPEEVYEMDDGDNLLQGIDTVLIALE